MDSPVRISFGASPSTLAMEMAMEWRAWLNGPTVVGLCFALREDYSGADMVYQETKKVNGEFKDCLYFADGEEVPDSVQYCAWLPAPLHTPRCDNFVKKSLKLVK
jgi:hypothetical protein